MRTYTDCLPCFLRGTLDITRRLALPEGDAEALLRKTLMLMSRLNWQLPPPMISREIYAMIRLITQSTDPYLRQKIADTERALRLLPDIERSVAYSKTPFLTAVQFAVAGNAIDLGAKRGTEVDVRKSFETASDHPIDVEAVSRLEALVSASKHVLFLADNAGEIVFDRPLLDLIGSDKVTVAVRGAPVINDATLDDAKRSGLAERYRIVSNGSDAPGTCLDDCTRAFRTLFRSADLVISKGQGNYECLNQEARRIAFLFLVKCPLVAGHTGLPISTFAVLIKNDAAEESRRDQE